MHDASRRYPTDLSEPEWAALEPLLPPLASRGRPLKWPRRLMAEAIFYLVLRLRLAHAAALLPALADGLRALPALAARRDAPTHARPAARPRT